ncbi:MAG: hypothetical protein JW765_04790 [Deltaproteobacteria bacterium]|nr:hypothetical protein [Candidatus Zymogenaceae bacterium]
MKRLPDVIRLTKCALGILLIVCFFLPWVAQTPSCLDKSVVIRDNISGFTLAVEGTAREAWLAPVFGTLVAGLALFLRGRAAPLTRSLVSLFETPAALIVIAYIDLSVTLFTPFVVRYGYVGTLGLFWAISILSFSEVVVHFPRLTRPGKIIVAAVAVLFIVLASFDYLSGLSAQGLRQ